MFGSMLRRTRPFLYPRSIWIVLVLTVPGTPAWTSDLDAFNPATTDPAQFRIAVRHSHRLEVPEGGARVKVLMKDRKTGQVLRERDILLAETVPPVRPEKLLTGRRRDERVSVYRIPERQVAELRALQAKYLSLPRARQEAIAGELIIDVAGCKLDPDDTGQMLISTYLRTSEFRDYVLLEKDFDLRNVPPGSASQQDDPVKPCSETR